MRIIGLAATAGLLLGLAALAAADTIRSERITLALGGPASRIEGRIGGDETLDLVFAAEAGQTLTADFAPDNLSAYFNLIPPGSTGVATFIGSIEGNSFAGALPESGDWTLRIYLMRNAARRDEAAGFVLDLALAAATGDALVPGTPFHATGEVPCARTADAPMGRCAFGVVRAGGGDAELTVFWPDGATTAVRYERGAPVAPEGLSAERSGDLLRLRIGDQRIEIPDAAPFGG